MNVIPEDPSRSDECNSLLEYPQSVAASLAILTMSGAASSSQQEATAARGEGGAGPSPRGFLQNKRSMGEGDKPSLADAVELARAKSKLRTSKVGAAAAVATAGAGAGAAAAAAAAAAFPLTCPAAKAPEALHPRFRSRSLNG